MNKPKKPLILKKTLNMKKITLMIFMLLILSCKEKVMNDVEIDRIDKIADSIVNSEKEKRKLPDSIIIIEQEKVIGNIKFGDSEKETKKNLEVFIKKSKRKEYSNSIFPDCFIGNYKFNGDGVYDLYYKSKIYKLHITGHPILYEDYKSEIPRQIEYIKAVISEKYKEPDITNSIPESFETEKGYTYEVHNWNIGSKKIEISINDKGDHYTVNIEIYQPNIVKILEKAQLEEDKNMTNKDKNTF